MIALFTVQLCTAFLLIRLRRRQTVSVVLSTLLTVHFCLWNIVPTWLTLHYMSRYIVPASRVGFDAFTTQAVTDSLIFLAVVLALTVVRKPHFQFICCSRMGTVPVPPKARLLLTLAAAILAVGIMARAGTGDTYLARNAFAIAEAGSDQYNALGMLELVRALATAYLFVVLIWLRPEQKTDLIALAIASAATVSVVGGAVVAGSRIALLTPLLVIVLRGQTMRWPARTKGIAALVVCGGLLAAAVLTVVLSSLRQQPTSYSFSDIAAESGAYVAGSGPWGAIFDEIGLALVEKTDSYSAGAFLVHKIGFGTAGLRPFWGSALALIPRYFVPQKPVPGSYDGTYLGHPARLTAAALGYDAKSGSVGVSPAAVSMWQLGYLGLLLLAVATIFYLWLVNSLLVATSTLARSLGIYAVSVPALAFLYTSPDAILLQVLRILAILLLSNSALAVIARRRTSGHQPSCAPRF